ncbi:hypothetical protein JCM3775_000424 [Rhodotorula graminis]|uniref:Proteophosphoglycan ppg4 n=1 Tax=Rhodotorula graminis (strain WP1) TaxID=578459 RepID=A0A194SA27_RHOGW|nr:uncharacterized protein RHOBADRAFT_51308 [Rhodotorula graminis WP1]KPV77457.1 hypothetical protein RHOBADRAFT_51308 [Rhodotorula graminis WP1]
MSGIFGGSGGTSLIPPGTEWIAGAYGQLLEMVGRGESPYSFLQQVIFLLYHPKVPRGFSVQLWFLFGLFCFATIVILLGLSLRLAQGRFWVFARIDGTLVMPNTATLYGLCALVYQGIGLFLIVLSVDVAQGADQKAYYQGLRRSWFGAIWFGVYFELWSCLCSWYVRARGAYYKPSISKRVLAIVVPLVLPVVAWVPPAILFTRSSQDYNASFEISEDITATLGAWGQQYRSGDKLDISQLAQLFVPGAELGNFLTVAARDARIGYAYVAAVLLFTFLIYLLAISLEVSHLSATVSQLRARARQAAFARSPGRRAADKPPSEMPHGPLPEHVLAQLEADQLDQDGQMPWALLAWVRRNRLYTAACIATMLLVNAALDLWQAVTPLDLSYPSGQFQVEILVSCWLNGLLSTLVALLLLFRSLDATTSPFLSLLRSHLPFLPFPPSVSLSPSSRSIITSEPPRFASAYAAAGVMPLVERSAIHTLPNTTQHDFDRDLGGRGEHEYDGALDGSVDAVPVALSEASSWADDDRKVAPLDVEHGWTRGRGSGSTARERGET